MNIVCVSHLRWDFVFQRPQHLLSRAAKRSCVCTVEEPIDSDGPRASHVTPRRTGVLVARAASSRLRHEERTARQQRLLEEAFRNASARRLCAVVLHADGAAVHAAILMPRAVVYDCMDELSAFAGAPPELRELRARAVRAGGRGVHRRAEPLRSQARRSTRNVHAFPSSVDVAHFAQARDSA